jgi:hypothetical protein
MAFLIIYDNKTNYQKKAEKSKKPVTNLQQKKNNEIMK